MGASDADALTESECDRVKDVAALLGAVLAQEDLRSDNRGTTGYPIWSS